MSSPFFVFADAAQQATVDHAGDALAPMEDDNINPLTGAHSRFEANSRRQLAEAAVAAGATPISATPPPPQYAGELTPELTPNMLQRPDDRKPLADVTRLFKTQYPDLFDSPADHGLSKKGSCQNTIEDTAIHGQPQQKRSRLRPSGSSQPQGENRTTKTLMSFR